MDEIIIVFYCHLRKVVSFNFFVHVDLKKQTKNLFIPSDLCISRGASTGRPMYEDNLAEMQSLADACSLMQNLN